ncbi:hypothetical protein [Nakamurella lactea]|uniref:hypothetical protein n=1 Tax=Nakamurella lactea TaxID=459515 RepID=UPI0003FF5F58|nr:hypothetical protein [Nakamurella lactea]
MGEPTGTNGVTVLGCLSEDAFADPAAVAASPWLRGVGRLLDCQNGHRVGPRPGKQIDPLLVGRVLVIGEDADLAAVALRLLRTDGLGSVELAYVSRLPTAFTAARRLPTGPAGLRTAGQGVATPTTLLRDDSGGVLLAEGIIAPITGLVYADEHRLLAGPATRLLVRPDDLDSKGLTVTVTRRRRFGVFGGGSGTTAARAVQVTGEPMTPTLDGVVRPRPVTTWIWYRHTEPLLLVRAQP